MFTYSENLRRKEHHVDSFAIADEIMSLITDYLTVVNLLTDAKLDVDDIQLKLKNLLDTPGFDPKVQRRRNDLFGRLLVKLHSQLRLSWSFDNSYKTLIRDDDPIVWPVVDRLLAHPSTRLTDIVHTVRHDHFTVHDVQMTLTEALFFALDERKFMETLSRIIDWDSFDCNMSIQPNSSKTISNTVLKVCGENVELALRIVKHPTFNLTDASDWCWYATPLTMAVQQRCLPVVRVVLEMRMSQKQFDCSYEEALLAVSMPRKADGDSTEDLAILRLIMEHPMCRVNDIPRDMYSYRVTPRLVRTLLRCEKFDMQQMPRSAPMNQSPFL